MIELYKYAIENESNKLVLAEFAIKNIEGIGRKLRSCPLCGQNVILSKKDQDPKNVSHWRHDKFQNECKLYKLKENYDIKTCNIYAKKSDKEKKKFNELPSQYATQFLIQLLKSYTVKMSEKCAGSLNCESSKPIETFNDKNSKENITYREQCAVKKDGNRMIVDLARLVNGKITHVFEIKDTHPTDENKRKNIGCDWFDVDCQYLIAKERKINEKKIKGTFNPNVPIKIYSTRSIYRCNTCKEEAERKEFAINQKKYIKDIKSKLFETIYCRNCKKKNTLKLQNDNSILYCKHCHEICNCESCFKYLVSL